MMDNNFHNNGLDYAANFNDFTDKGLGAITGSFTDNGLFRTPHIRNIEVTGPYMRDGRFSTLEEVVEFYNSGLKLSPTVDPQMKFAHQGGIQYLSAYDKQALVAFMKTLTDTTFLNNPKFSNPFEQ
jgi:cytochrome c peroxidase